LHVPDPVADQLPATALVFTVVGAQALAVPFIVRALAAVVSVSIRRAPLPEVGAATVATPAIAAIGARAPPPEGGERLHPLARGAALRAWHPSSDLLRAGSFRLPREHGPCHLGHTYGRHVRQSLPATMSSNAAAPAHQRGIVPHSPRLCEKNPEKSRICGSDRSRAPEAPPAPGGRPCVGRPARAATTSSTPW